MTAQTNQVSPIRNMSFSMSCVALPEGLLLASAGGVVQSVQEIPSYLHEVSGRRGGTGPYTGHKAS